MAEHSGADNTDGKQCPAGASRAQHHCHDLSRIPGPAEDPPPGTPLQTETSWWVTEVYRDDGEGGT